MKIVKNHPPLTFSMSSHPEYQDSRSWNGCRQSPSPFRSERIYCGLVDFDHCTAPHSMDCLLHIEVVVQPLRMAECSKRNNRKINLSFSSESP